MKILGLPCDVMRLLWLTDRLYYVSIDGSNSILCDLLLGTVQGSILGPIVFIIIVSPIFDKEHLFPFEDDTFVPRIKLSLIVLINNMKKSQEALTKWLKEAGLKVKESTTELFFVLQERCSTNNDHALK
jgi:hypothetical protein